MKANLFNADKKEDEIISDNNQNFNSSKKGRKIEYKYTINEGDHRRLNKGNLIVYNLDRPVAIPYKKLFSNWKKSPVGTTLTFKNNEWEIDGEKAETANNYPSPFILMIHRLVIKYKSLYILEKLRIER